MWNRYLSVCFYSVYGSADRTVDVPPGSSADVDRSRDCGADRCYLWVIASVQIAVAARSSRRVHPVCTRARAGRELGRRRRVDEWFREIGYRGRGTVIVLFAIGIAVGSQVPLFPTLLLADIAYGGLGACVLFTALHLAVARNVSGWTASQSDVDES